MSRRKYELRQRAETQAQTRARIVKAALELHGTVGPARTNISEIARLAGVERRTIYNHFQHDHELFQECGALWVEERPPPDPGGWQGLDDPSARTRAALAAIYAYYDRNADELEPVLRDSLFIAPLRDVLEHGWFHYLAGVSEDLVRASRRRGQARVRVAAVVALAVDLGSWRRLTTAGRLSGDAAAALMSGLIEAAGRV